MIKKLLFALLSIFLLIVAVQANEYYNDTGPPGVVNLVEYTYINDAANITVTGTSLEQINLFERGVIVLGPGDINTISYDALKEKDYAVIYSDALYNEILNYQPANSKLTIVAYSVPNNINHFLLKGRCTWF